MKDNVVQQAVRQAGQDGVLFRSEDGRQLVQARLDGFTFNRLKPYDRWETFRDEARAHWERYKAVAMPERVTRIALRYINRLELPLPIEDFKDYLHTVPEIAPRLPQGLRTFFMRLEVPDDSRDAVAIITETMQEPVDEGRILPLILDIDVVRQASFDPDGTEMWEQFERLRDLKNEIFFSSVTEKTRALFE